MTRLGIADNSFESHERFANELLSNWATNKFTSFNSLKSISLSERSEMYSSDKKELTSKQKRLLDKALAGFFDAYSIGSYEAYLQFRRPSGVDYEWRTNSDLAFRQYFTKGPIYGSAPIIERWRRRYRTHGDLDLVPRESDDKFRAYVRDFSNDKFYKDYWTGVCLDNARILVTTAKGLPGGLWEVPFFPLMKFKGFSADATFPNLGYGSQKDFRFFDLKPTMSDVLGRSGDLTLVNCFFLVKCSPPDTFMPVLVRFYWCEAEGVWLPDDVVLANVRVFYDLYPVF